MIIIVSNDWEILVNLYEFTNSLLQVVHFIGAVCLQFWIGAASFRRNEELKNVSECSITGLLGYGILEHECTCSYGNRMAQRPNSLFPYRCRFYPSIYLVILKDRIASFNNPRRNRFNCAIIRRTVIERSVKHRFEMKSIVQ